MEVRLAAETSQLPCALCGQGASDCSDEDYESCQGILYLGNVFGATPLYFSAAPRRSIDRIGIGDDHDSVGGEDRGARDTMSHSDGDVPNSVGGEGRGRESEPHDMKVTKMLRTEPTLSNSPGKEPRTFRSPST
jgi:hypothetical protein